METLLGLLVLVWLLIGAFAAFQRGYFGDERDVSYKTAVDTVLTVGTPVGSGCGTSTEFQRQGPRVHKQGFLAARSHAASL